MEYFQYGHGSTEVLIRLVLSCSLYLGVLLRFGKFYFSFHFLPSKTKLDIQEVVERLKCKILGNNNPNLHGIKAQCLDPPQKETFGPLFKRYDETEIKPFRFNLTLLDFLIFEKEFFIGLSVQNKPYLSQSPSNFTVL